MDTHVIGKTLIFNPQGQFLVLRRSPQDTHRPGDDDIPGGQVEDAEAILDGAVREVEEETGLRLQPEHMRLVYAYTAAGHRNDINKDINFIHLVFAVQTERTEVTLSNEHDAYYWLSLKEAIQKTNHTADRALLEYIYEHRIAADLWELAA